MRFEEIICGGLCWDALTLERLQDEKCLERYGFKVYSQNDEDGIIQEIFRRIKTTDKRFVEFGIGVGIESNCHYLLHKGWSGLWIEGSPDFVKEAHVKFRPVIKNGQLRIKNAFITKDNINDLLISEGFSGEIDLLSIDIDGNDYYVWQAINAVRPRVVVIEYNGKFPPDCVWKQAYNSKHIWDNSDWHGASLKAYELLGRELGYQLVGTGLKAVNAFFVRNDLTEDKFITPATSEKLYNPSRHNLRFIAPGQPARYCLVAQEEELGSRNYYEDGKLPKQKGRLNKLIRRIIHKIGTAWCNG